jgi:hypothetical protein
VIAGALLGVVVPRFDSVSRKYTPKFVPAGGASRLAVYGWVWVVPGEVVYALCTIGVEVSFPLSSTTWT